MNRTNRSGIIKGGVIGGKEQSGIWRLDARFNKKTLIERIKKIAAMKHSIHLYNKDIDSFLTHYVPKYEENAFLCVPDLWKCDNISGTGLFFLLRSHSAGRGAAVLR